MSNRFEGFDPQGDLEYVKKLLGEGHAESLREKLGIESSADAAEVRDEEVRDEDDGGWGESDPVPVDETAAVEPGEHSPEDAGSIPEVIGGEPTCGTDTDAPAAGPFPERERAAAPNRVHGPEGQGPVPDPVKPSEPVREPTRVPPSSELSPAEKRSRDVERLWGWREQAYYCRAFAGTNKRDQLIADGLVSYIQLILVKEFGESVPFRGKDWSENRKQLEIQLLERRLAYVESHRLAPFRGWRGIVNWLKGNKKTSAGNFYSKAIAKWRENLTLRFRMCGSGWTCWRGIFREWCGCMNPAIRRRSNRCEKG